MPVAIVSQRAIGKPCLDYLLDPRECVVKLPLGQLFFLGDHPRSHGRGTLSVLGAGGGRVDTKSERKKREDEKNQRKA